MFKLVRMMVLMKLVAPRHTTSAGCVHVALVLS